MCVASASALRVVNLHPSSVHRKTTPDSCSALWWYASAFLARNALPHPGYLHANGRSSVCVRLVRDE